ncbi:MAG TPA: hypothetical protein VL400_19230 [Polyangiaceae bacterium]|nr:hypothetical protein [Polyangiaceae bacterium]
MPVPDALLGDAAVAGPLGSLGLSCVRPANATMGLRALRWHESLTRLGVVLPLFLVHDVGMLFGVPPEQREIVARCNPSELATSRVPLSTVTRLVDVYRAILAELADSEASRRAGQLKLGDDLVAAVLARLLGVVAARAQGRPAYPSRVPVDPSILERIEPQLGGLFRSVDRTWDTGAIETLELARLFVLTLADSLDTDTLKLFGLLGTDSGASAMGHVDLLAAFQSPEANDIVNFSLEILPSVLETKTRPAAGTSLAQGYSGIGNRGSIDSMVLTELAWDDLELARRLFDNELLYYAREQSRDEQKRIHILLVDASASMRGDRTTFARGMALATGKKLLLEGEDVVFRFFDSRLYEPARAKGDRMPTAYLLSFKGERGRNPARVFAELSTELELMKTRDARAPVVHLFTHAALYIPRELVANVRQLAHIAAVFILPSGGKLDLDYLDVLDAHWVVDHETLSQRGARGEAAKSILGQSEGLRRDLEGADPAPKPDVAVEAPPASRRITGRADAPPPSRRSPDKGASP